MEWISDMGSPFSPADIALRVFLAVIFGGIVGWDREASQKAAGLRTHMLVSLGAAVFTLTALESDTGSGSGKGTLGDPTRVIQGIAGGIGFLGAGQIIQARGGVAGVTTAAGIWVVGALGVACGGGHYLLAGLTMLFVIVILRGVVLIEAWMGTTNSPDKRAAEMPPDEDAAAKRRADSVKEGKSGE